jgi:hypothetical protein
MQARMLKLRTRTQQVLALIVTARCAASATVECVTERWKMLTKWKCDYFLLPQHFFYKFLSKSYTANETWKSWLLTLSAGNSKLRLGRTRAKQHDGWTTETEVLNRVFLDFLWVVYVHVFTGATGRHCFLLLWVPRPNGGTWQSAVKYN